MYRKIYDLHGDVHIQIIDTLQDKEEEIVSLTTEDTFQLSGGGTNWRELVTTDRRLLRVTISYEQSIRTLQDPILEKTNYCMASFVDAFTLVYYVRKRYPEKGYALIIQDFFNK